MSNEETQPEIVSPEEAKEAVPVESAPVAVESAPGADAIAFAQKAAAMVAAETGAEVAGTPEATLPPIEAPPDATAALADLLAALESHDPETCAILLEEIKGHVVAGQWPEVAGAIDILSLEVDA